MMLMNLTLEELVEEITETSRSDGVSVPENPVMDRVRMFFKTGDTELGLIAVTTGATTFSVIDELSSDYSFTTTVITAVVAPAVNFSVIHVI